MSEEQGQEEKNANGLKPVVGLKRSRCSIIMNYTSETPKLETKTLVIIITLYKSTEDNIRQRALNIFFLVSYNKVL